MSFVIGRFVLFQSGVSLSEVSLYLVIIYVCGEIVYISDLAVSLLSFRLRAVVDTLLLDALSINQTQLVLSFSHLAVGGAYISATNSTHLLASIRVLMNGSVVIDVGSEEGDVVVEAEGNSTVQVSVCVCGGGGGGGRVHGE